jgi:hypothetical protein
MYVKLIFMLLVGHFVSLVGLQYRKQHITISISVPVASAWLPQAQSGV